jgi:hypothetical protein
VSTQLPAELAATRPWRERMHGWIVQHDESRWFMGLYLGLALVLSIAIGLFWLVALVVVHFGFEYVRFRHDDASPANAVGRALWELKLDVSLVLFAFALTLYLQVVLGVLGIQAASRVGVAAQAGVRSGARFAAWENAIRGVLLSEDDAVLGARAIATVRRKKAQESGRDGSDPGAEPTTPPDPVAATEVATEPRAGADQGLGDPTSDAKRWSLGDRIALTLGGVSLLLIVAAPWFGHDGWMGVLTAILAELHPFPF